MPEMLKEPPAEWEKEFVEMAAEIQLSTADLSAAFATLSAFWQTNNLQLTSDVAGGGNSSPGSYRG